MTEQQFNRPLSLRARVTLYCLRLLVSRRMMDMSKPSLLIKLRRQIAKWDIITGFLSRLFGSRFNHTSRVINGVNVEEVTARQSPSTQHNIENTVLLYFHGGGFFFRSIHAHMKLASQICKTAGIARAIVPLYRLAPEHLYPAAIEDCVAVYKHLLNQGTAASQIVFAGDSAGGGLALSALVNCREQNLPMPSAVALMSPVTDLSHSGKSNETNRDLDPLFGSVPMTKMDFYLGNAAVTNPCASPYFASFNGFPPMLVQVGSTERLLDDSVRLQDNARRANISITVQIWHQLPHVWQTMGLPESKQAILCIATFLASQLNAWQMP